MHATNSFLTWLPSSFLKPPYAHVEPAIPPKFDFLHAKPACSLLVRSVDF